MWDQARSVQGAGCSQGAGACARLRGMFAPCRSAPSEASARHLAAAAGRARRLRGRKAVEPVRAVAAEALLAARAELRPCLEGGAEQQTLLACETLAGLIVG